MKDKTRSFAGILWAAALISVAFSIFCCRAGAENQFEVKKRKINEISSPTLGAPAIVKAGTAFLAEIDAGQGCLLKKATLTSSGGSGAGAALDFVPDPSGGESAYKVVVPAGLAEGLYDLHAEFSDGRSDVQYHAVKVIKDFKSDFSFTVISDIHFGDNRGDDLAPGKNLDDIRRNVLKAACGGNAEFVLLTGDVTSMPYDYTRDYEKAWTYFKDYCAAPLFAVGGNHDGYGVRKDKDTFADGKLYWRAILGAPYYFFDYGEMRFIGVDDYDWPPKFRSANNIALMNQSRSLNTGNISPAQFDWLKGVLASAGDKTKVVFAHLPFQEMTGGKAVLQGGEPNPGVAAETVLQLFRENDVRYLFVGHWHRNKTEDLGGITQYMTNTAGSYLEDKSQSWGFNTVFVKNRKIDRIEYQEVGF